MIYTELKIELFLKTNKVFQQKKKNLSPLYFPPSKIKYSILKNRYNKFSFDYIDLYRLRVKIKNNNRL